MEQLPAGAPPTGSPALCHHEQTRSNRCVPACACIILKWRGLAAEEEGLCSQWPGSRRGYALRDAARSLGGQFIQADPDDLRADPWLRVTLAEPRWLIAQMFGGPLTEFTLRNSPGMRSRFGPLTESFVGPPLHTIVLVQADDQKYWYLDPYYPAPGQPLWLSSRQLVKAWQGGVVVP